jgi:hypothetical protein
VGYVLLGLLGVVLIAVSTFIIQIAWNAVIEGLFHGPHLTFWLALGVNVLLGLAGRTFKRS